MSIDEMALIGLALVFAVNCFLTNRTLFRHQKALEWFASHIHLSPKAMPGNAPPELWDLVSGKERNNHGE